MAGKNPNQSAMHTVFSSTRLDSPGSCCNRGIEQMLCVLPRKTYSFPTRGKLQAQRAAPSKTIRGLPPFETGTADDVAMPDARVWPATTLLATPVLNKSSTINLKCWRGGHASIPRCHDLDALVAPRRRRTRARFLRY